MKTLQKVHNWMIWNRFVQSLSHWTWPKVKSKISTPKYSVQELFGTGDLRVKSGVNFSLDYEEQKKQNQ